MKASWCIVWGMVLKLDPRFPLVWRSPSSLQLGVDPARVTFDEVSETTERLLAALVAGVGLPGLTMLARGRVGERDDLLELVAPILLPENAPAPSAPIVAVSGSGRTADAIAATLHSDGVRVVAAAANDRPQFAVVVGHYVLAPELHGHWLRRDVPHLPVVLTDSGVVVGPVIRPGAGPCLHCLELHRRDADSAWPAIATQLLGRRSLVESATAASEVAALVARVVFGELEVEGGGFADAATSIRLDATTGDRTTTEWAVHAECGCLGVGRVLEPPAREDRPTRRVRLAT